MQLEAPYRRSGEIYSTPHKRAFLHDASAHRNRPAWRAVHRAQIWRSRYEQLAPALRLRLAIPDGQRSRPSQHPPHRGPALAGAPRRASDDGCVLTGPRACGRRPSSAVGRARPQRGHPGRGSGPGRRPPDEEMGRIANRFQFVAANNQSGQFERLTIGTRHRRQGLKFARPDLNACSGYLGHGRKFRVCTRILEIEKRIRIDVDANEMR